MHFQCMSDWTGIAERQAGAIARHQLRSLGFPPTTIDSRVARGSLRAVATGVYVVPGCPDTLARRRWVAHLALGPASTLGFETAGSIHRLPSAPPAGPVVCIVRDSGWRKIDGIAVHQLTDLRPDHVIDHDGIPCTTVARTIVDLAAEWRLGRVAMALDDVVAAKKTTYADVGACLRSVARRGKPGVRTLTTLLDERGSGTVPAGSVLEAALIRLAATAGLPVPRRQYPLPRSDGAVGLVDLAWPELRLIVEVDGRRWHQRIADLKRDRERDLQAAAAGWLVVRLLHEHIIGAPAETVRELRSVMRARGLAA